MGKGEWTDFPIFKSKRFFGILTTLRKMWSEELERGYLEMRLLFNPMQTNLTKMSCTSILLQKVKSNPIWKKVMLLELIHVKH